MKSVNPMKRDSVKSRAILSRFRDAFVGVILAYREEPTLRFQLFAASCAALAGYAVRLAAWEAAYLAATITTVLLAEMVNTAVERAVDFAAGGRRHRLAAQAKDVAAGAALLAAAHAVFAAALVFLVERGFSQTLSAVASLVRHSPWLLLVPAVAGVLGVLVSDRRL